MNRELRTHRFVSILTALVGWAAASAVGARVEMIRSVEEEWLELDGVVITAPIRDGFSFRGIGGVTIQTVTVADVVHGSIEPGPMTITIGVDEFDYPWFRLEEGRRYLLELRAPDPETGRRTATDAVEAEAHRVARYRQWFDRLPPWSEPIDGVSIRAVPSRYTLGVGADLSIYLAFKNVSAKPRLLRIGTSPLLAHVALDIDGPKGQTIEAVDYPHAPRDEIEAHFAAHGHDHSRQLAPGEINVQEVWRVNSAKKGSGYKQRLGFRFYPLTEPGRYTIRTRAIGFRNQVLVAAPFAIDVRP